MKLYLAHPFDSRVEIRTWELRMEETYPGLELVNPFYDLARVDIEKCDDGRSKRYEEIDPTKLVSRDIKAIVNSDGIVAIIDGSLSYGTIMEIVYAKGIGNLVYLIVTNGHEGHPWLRYHATKIFTSKQDFEDFIKGELDDEANREDNAV